jgi:glucose/arabinose dehydrogenase
MHEDSFYIEDGYKLELIASGFTYPTSIAFDEPGNVFISESGSFGQASVLGGGKIKRVFPNGEVTTLASGFESPLTGITIHKGIFYASCGGDSGKIFRAAPDENWEEIVSGLPTGGDHHISNIVFDLQDKMYFANGTYTNSSVAGPDGWRAGWLTYNDGRHDIPPTDYILRGENFPSVNPFVLDRCETVMTGSFKPFREKCSGGELIRGQLKASGVIYRSNPDGSNLAQFAGGFRNPCALAVSPENRLFCIDQGFEARGSRPVANAPDTMWEVMAGGWYGWPDYCAGEPVSQPKFRPEGGEIPRPVLAKHPPLSGKLVVAFWPSSSAMGFDFSTSQKFGFEGEAFVPLSGPLGPANGDAFDKQAQRVVRLNMQTGSMRDFLRPYGESSKPRFWPVDVKFNPEGSAMYVLSFGEVSVNESGIFPYSESGTLYRIIKK